MTYLEVKTINGQYYLYRYESYRHKGKPKRRMVKYYGRITPHEAHQIIEEKKKYGK